MRILALDLATTTGWAVGGGNVKVRHGTLRLHASSLVGIGGICAELIDRVADLVVAHEPNRVIFEAPMMIGGRSAHTARVLIGLSVAVEIFCYRRSIPCTEERVDTVRSAVLGRARFGGRDEAKLAVMKWAGLVGYKPANDNEADALALLDYALGMHRQGRLKPCHA
jgi:Holliday junction resolvasome RuvABC endonuclease subunit